MSFTGIGPHHTPLPFQPSDSGNGHSGVRRVSGASPSSPLRVSIKTSEPQEKRWCGAAVATTSGELGIGFASVVV